MSSSNVVQLTQADADRVRNLLDEIEDNNLRREARELTTWDFFVHSTSERPMYGGNPVVEAAASWEFGQQLWTDDEVFADTDENENLRQMRKMMRGSRA